MIWTGIAFAEFGHRDGRFLHAPGLFGFVRRYTSDDCLLLFAGQAEDLAREAGPSHPMWAEALRLGLNELHVHQPVLRRVDRLELLARVVRHPQPILNCLEEATASLPPLEHARLRA